MVDPHLRFGRDDGLGMKGDAEAGGADHVEIVGAIADGKSRGQRNFVEGGEGLKAAELGLAADDRIADGAGEHLAIDFEDIGHGFVEADALADVVGKEGEAARNQRGEGAVRLHGLHEGTAAGGIGNAFAAHFFHALHRQALEQGDAGAQRRLEIELAIHGAGGDGGDFVLDADGIGELVDALLLDHGRIHVGDEQLLAPIGERHEGDIDGPAGDDVVGGLYGGVEFRLDDLDRDALGEPVDFTANGRMDARNERRVEGRISRVGDEAKDRQGVLVARKFAVLIAGPTASGKSALALERARELGGSIVNTDALQVYDGLRLVTARPDETDLGAVPHLFYGAVDPGVRFSTGDWARAAERIIAEADEPLVFAGGTGLYFETLTKGFADVPEVPDEAVAEATREVEGLDREGRAALIAARDRAIAARLKAPDPQRVIRALAVLRATGRSLASFQDELHAPLLEGWEMERVVLNPEREVLRERIARRFAAMLEQGAADEVAAFLARGLDPSLPAMKAIGVREIGDWLAGTIGRDEMITRAVTATRQYAKRQRTWFRGRMADWDWIAP